MKEAVGGVMMSDVRREEKLGRTNESSHFFSLL